MGHKTRKADGIAKIIIEVPTKKHILFKTICASKDKTMKAVVEPFIDEFIALHMKEKDSQDTRSNKKLICKG